MNVVIPASKIVKQFVCDCENADWTTLKFELANVEWVHTLRKLNSDDAVDWLASTVLRIVDDCIPSKRSLINMFRTREQITNVIAHSVKNLESRGTECYFAARDACSAEFLKTCHKYVSRTMKY